MIRLREVVGLSSDAAFAVNQRCRVAAWNERAEQMLGYMRAEVLGRPCRDILQAVLPNGEPLCVPRCEPFRCFRNCRPRGIGACRVRRKDGDWHTVGYSSLVALPRKAPPRENSVLAVVLLHNQGSCDDVADQEHTLRVSTLGRFALTMAGEGIAIDRWARKQSITLLKFLVTQAGRPVHRERILDCLWPTTDTPRGWDRLKVTISYLRQQLRALGLEDDVLQTVGKAYLLRRDAIRVDADVFENLIAEGHALQSRNRDAEALRRFCQADSLYRGDYLEEETFADWCAEERERLRELYLEMLGDMVRCYATSGNYGEAVRLSRRALVQEPCRESFHATLIRTLARLGHVDQAVAQYRTCRQVLADELGVEPMPETQKLYRQILENPAVAGMSP